VKNRHLKLSAKSKYKKRTTKGTIKNFLLNIEFDTLALLLALSGMGSGLIAMIEITDKSVEELFYIAITLISFFCIILSLTLLILAMVIYDECNVKRSKKQDYER
jgi:uncharacterized membrane protein